MCSDPLRRRAASLWQSLTGVLFSTPPTPVRLQKEKKKKMEDGFRQENI